MPASFGIMSGCVSDFGTLAAGCESVPKGKPLDRQRYDKVKRLAERAIFPGERQAAQEAMRRMEEEDAAYRLGLYWSIAWEFRCMNIKHRDTPCPTV